jgi:rhodanese-related sulfurtransferase
MNYLKSTTQIIAVGLIVFFASCSGGGNQKEHTEKKANIQIKAEPVEINTEAKALLNYLDEMGDYVNGRNFPSLIKAASVFEEMGNNNHIIDLRSAEKFEAGHIKGAVNVDFSNLPNYFTNNIKPFEFDRIVMVCYAGQIASYATSLLRLLGYGNVYAMRWGMSAWNKDFAADSWLDAVSSEFEGKLDLNINVKSDIGDFPQMNTGKTVGEEIMNQQFTSLFEAGYSDALISAEKVFEQPQNYYIINYDRRDKYEAGHIPGAIRYKPNGTLGIIKEMQTIPSHKEVVVYCGTGHNSGFVSAYLRLFGYDAKTLTYGNNAFMYDKMIQERNTLSWLPFTQAEIGDYPMEKN